MHWKSKLLLLSAGFMAEFELVFAITRKTLFHRGFILNPTERA